MPHNDIPTNFNLQVVLLNNINKKVNADGPTGALVAMLAEKGIDLATDVASGVAATANDANFQLYTKTSQDEHQQRELLMDKLNDDCAGCFQFLKNFYTPNFKQVGQWGVTISDTGKISYPTTTAEQVALFGLMQTKNNSYVAPAISPLAAYISQHNMNFAQDATNGAAAIVLEASFLAAKAASENYRQLRDNGWAQALADVHTIGAFLMVLYKGNAKALGYYGFTVVNTARVVKKRDIVILMGSVKLAIQLKVGSTITNVGTTDINIYQGKTIAGTPLLIAAGNSFVTTQGYSFFSAENLSTTASGKLSFIVA